MQGEYRMKGGDGQEYGPVGLEEMQSWIAQNRVNAETPVRRGDDEWAAAAAIPELGLGRLATPAQDAPATVPGTPGAHEVVAAMLTQIQSAGSWFFWVAALTVVNSASALGGSDWRFVFGLGITQVIDAIGADVGSNGKIIVLALDGVVVLFLIGCGIFARKGHGWVFLLGMLLFLLDTGVFILGSDWLGVAFHAYLVFAMFRGFRACQELKSWIGKI